MGEQDDSQTTVETPDRSRRPAKSSGGNAGEGGHFWYTSIRRVWAAPIGAHAVALALVLGLSLWVSSPLVAHSSDEGAAILEAKALDRSHSWLIPNPVAALDTSGAALPIPRADSGPKGRAPYAKHPLYPLVLLLFSRLFGDFGYWLSSVLGAWGACVLGARVARRLDPAAERPVLWALGVASPLLFDATWVLAHSLAAATATAAVLLVMNALSEPRAINLGKGAVLVVGAAVMVALVTGLRSEGALLGLALAAACVGFAVQSRRVGGVVIGGVLIVTVWATRLAERIAFHAILGGAPAQGLPGPQGSAGDYWLIARWHAVQVTLLRPAYQQSRTSVLLVGGAIALVGGAVAARRRAAPQIVAGFDVVAVAAYGLCLFGPNHPDVPGLLIACPLVGAGLVCVRLESFRAAQWNLVAITAGVTVLAVLASEYAIGGGIEWGGRYFALVLPLIIAALAPGVNRLDVGPRRALMAGLVATGIVVAALSLASARDKHRSTRELFSEIATCAAAARSPESPALDRRPLVTTSLRLVPQLGWASYGSYQWLAPEPGDLNRYLDRASSIGVRRLVLVTEAPTDVTAVGYRVETTCPSPFVSIRVLVSPPAPS